MDESITRPRAASQLLCSHGSGYRESVTASGDVETRPVLGTRGTARIGCRAIKRLCLPQLYRVREEGKASLWKSAMSVKSGLIRHDRRDEARVFPDRRTPVGPSHACVRAIFNLGGSTETECAGDLVQREFILLAGAVM